MSRILRIQLLPVALGAFLAVGQVSATTVTSTTFSSWKTGLTGNPTELDFNGLHYAGYNTSAGVTLSAIGNSSLAYTFTGPDNGNFVLSGASYNGTLSLEGSADAGAGIKVVTPGTGNNALLLYVASTSGTPLTLTLSDGESFSLGNGLIGLSISHPITSLSLTTTAGSQAVIGDFWFGSSNLPQDGGGGSPVPEARTTMLIAGGMLVLVGARRKFAAAAQA